MKEEKAYVTSSPAETRRLAYRLAKRLTAGDAVALVGKLGAGKTEFARGVAQALGVEREVSSPSFVRVHSYGGSPPLYHADFYFAKSPNDAADYGLDELRTAGGIVLIEWADRFPGLLPEPCWWVEFECAKGGPRFRSITVSAPGQKRIGIILKSDANAIKLPGP